MKNPRQMIKQAVLNLIDDTGPYPRGQADYNGKTTDFLHYIPYGLISSPPPLSWALLLSSQSQESLKVGLVADFINRKRNRIPGEAGVYNSLTGSFVLLKANGDIEIESPTNLSVSVVGNITLTAVGSVNLISTGIVNLGGVGGPGVARIGDAVAGGVITGGSTKVFSS